MAFFVVVVSLYFWLFECETEQTRHSRGDLRLHEDEDENQQSRQTAAKHHPDGKLTVTTQRIDDPASFLRTRHGETAGNAQFLHGGSRVCIVGL